MREIKFRAWDENLEEWIPEENIIICRGKPIAILHYQNLPIDEALNTKGKLINPDWILMQYTGLKDKKGTEIYEGDILQYKNYYVRIEVQWSGCGFIIYINGTGEDVGNELPELFSHHEQMEIRGNIYEHPKIN